MSIKQNLSFYFDLNKGFQLKLKVKFKAVIKSVFTYRIVK